MCCLTHDTKLIARDRTVTESSASTSGYPASLSPREQRRFHDFSKDARDGGTDGEKIKEEGEGSHR